MSCNVHLRLVLRPDGHLPDELSSEGFQYLCVQDTDLNQRGAALSKKIAAGCVPPGFNAVPYEHILCQYRSHPLPNEPVDDSPARN